MILLAFVGETLTPGAIARFLCSLFCAGRRVGEGRRKTAFLIALIALLTCVPFIKRGYLHFHDFFSPGLDALLAALSRPHRSSS